MTDLYIDAAMLARVRSSFRDIEQLLTGPGRAMRQLDSSDVGPAVLRRRLHEFGDEWAYGIDQLGEFSGTVVEALDRIEQAFEEADVELAAALREAKGDR